MNKDIKVVTTATGIAADEARYNYTMECLPLLVSLVNGFFQTNTLVVEFTTNVNVGSTGMHGITGNQTTFYQGVGILTDNFTILHRYKNEMNIKVKKSTWNIPCKYQARIHRN